MVAAVTGGSAPFWWKHVFTPPNMNIHGAWQTNVPHLGYEIDQTGKKYTWRIPGGPSGSGYIKGENIYSIVSGQEVHFFVVERDPSGRPIRLHSDHPQYGDLELFR